MLGRNRDKDQAHNPDLAPRARGGVSWGGILTGVVVALGALFLLSAVIGGVLAATGVADENVTSGEVVDAGIAGGIAFVVAQFLAYLWGGYTAGRMARGAGVLNGILVPLAAIVVALLVGAIAAGLGATAELNLPLQEARLPVEQNVAIDWGVGLGIAALVAMFVGGALGGGLGARWHTKLERRAADDVSHHPSADRGPQTDRTSDRPSDDTSAAPRSQEQESRR